MYLLMISSEACMSLHGLCFCLETPVMIAEQHRRAFSVQPEQSGSECAAGHDKGQPHSLQQPAVPQQ